MPPDSPPLLQLPHLNRASIKSIEDAALSSNRKHLTVQSFMEIPEAQRREIVKGAGLSSAQYETAITVANQLPRLVIEKAFFKVSGERYIIPSSLVQFVVKARFIPPGTTNIPDVHPSDLEDIDLDEADPKGRRQQEAEAQQHPPPLAHAPYLSRDHSPKWHLFLADAKQGKIAVPPFTFVTFDKPIVDANGKPTFNVQTLKMQFQAPPQPGQYKFQMHMVCDSYVGFDDKRDAILNVEDAAKADELDWEDDISEPEEGVLLLHRLGCNNADVWNADSIAGQMAALRGAGADEKPTPSKRRPVKKIEEDSDSGSATEEEEDEESTTDTDTSDEE